jgi:hypothetical protein
VIGFGDRCAWCQDRRGARPDAPGEYEGRHHTEWIGTVQVLVQEDDVVNAELLLRHLVGAADAEAAAAGQAPYGWYAEQLAALETRALGTMRSRASRSNNAA